MNIVDNRPKHPEYDYYDSEVQSVEAGGNPVPGLGGVYYATAGVEMTCVANILDDQGALATAIDAAALGYPPVLKLPVVKMAGGSDGTVVDEIYFTATIVAGVITCIGSVPFSGDWQVKTDRVNRSLLAIGADWQITSIDINFLV